MKKYQIIYADPPWSFKCFGKRNPNDNRVYRPSDYYKVMDIDDIKKLPIQDLADKNCILFIWAIDTMLPQAFEVIKAWGFTYKTVGFYWVKQNKDTSPFYGLGYWTRCNPEQCLLATKGKISRISKSIEKLTFAPRLEHSKKPNLFRQKIVELMGNLLRIELFARQKIEGWDCIGNEINGKDIKQQLEEMINE